MRILGIDPGLKGAIVVLEQGQPWRGFPLPAVKVDKGEVLNIPAVAEWLRQNMVPPAAMRAFLEKVHSMPEQGVASSFKFGRGFGALEGVLATLGIPYELVPPQRWTKVMHAGVEGADAKARSAIAAQRLFPAVDMVAPRGHKPHSGLIDASLLAEYGRRVTAGEGSL